MKPFLWDDVVRGPQARGVCRDGDGIAHEAAGHLTERHGLVSVPVEPVDQVHRNVRNLN
jgi:Protein of unknown function (DUF1059)